MRHSGNNSGNTRSQRRPRQLAQSIGPTGLHDDPPSQGSSQSASAEGQRSMWYKKTKSAWAGLTCSQDLGACPLKTENWGKSMQIIGLAPAAFFYAKCGVMVRVRVGISCETERRFQRHSLGRKERVTPTVSCGELHTYTLGENAGRQ